MSNYVADKFGNLAIAYTLESGKFAANLWNGEKWNRSPVDINAIRILAVGDRPDEVIAQREVFDGERADVRYLDLRTGEWGESLMRDEQYDFVGEFFRDPGTLKLVGAVYHRAGPAIKWFDENYVILQKILDSAFPGRVARIADADKKGENLVVHVFGDRQPSEYYLLNLPKKSVELISKSRPWIDESGMRPMNIIQFETAEGKELDAYVTMPENATGGSLPPMIVIPHGGPGMRNDWDFDPEAQFWANRGYAVLQPIDRGSPGYQWKFPREDRG